MGRYKKNKPTEDKIEPIRKPIFSIEKINFLKNHADEDVRELARILGIIYSDLESRMYASICMAIERLCQDMYMMSQTGILTEDKDDKVFDRFDKLMKNFTDYVKTISTGSVRLEKIGIYEPEEKSTSNENVFEKLKSKDGDNQFGET